MTFFLLGITVIFGGFLCALIVVAYRAGLTEGIRSSKCVLTSATVTLKAAQQMSAQSARDWQQAQKVTAATRAMHRSNELMIVLAGNLEAMERRTAGLVESLQNMGGERMNRRSSATGENPTAARAPKPSFEAPPSPGRWGIRESE